MSRKTARKHILNIVFQAEFDVDVEIKEIMQTYDMEYSTTEDVTDVKADVLKKTEGDKVNALRTIYFKDREFIIKEAEGIIAMKDEIDKLISDSLENWTIDRISKVDLAILRIAVYEILYADDIPDAVAANEAVQLAKSFGEEKSAFFINGVLGRIIKQGK